MPVESNGSSLFEAFVWLGGAIAAIVAGVAGYRTKPRREAATMVAGAIVDNTAIKPLLEGLSELTKELRVLIEIVARDVSMRESENAARERDKEADRIAELVTERLKKETERRED